MKFWGVNAFFRQTSKLGIEVLDRGKLLGVGRRESGGQERRVVEGLDQGLSEDEVDGDDQDARKLGDVGEHTAPRGEIQVREPLREVARGADPESPVAAARGPDRDAQPVARRPGAPGPVGVEGADVPEPEEGLRATLRWYRDNGWIDPPASKRSRGR